MKIDFLRKKETAVRTAIVFTAVIFFLLAAGVVFFGNYEMNSRNLAKYAELVIEKCSSKRFRPACYDEEIPKLMDDVTMEQAFEVAKIVQERDAQYGYCHVLGHNLSAREASKDISKWTDVIRRCPPGICSNGCLHGAAQERFRGETLIDAQIEELKSEIVGVCDPRPDWHPTGLEEAECIHGLGHLSVYLTGANMKKSLDVCDSIAATSGGGDLKPLCYEGAFMQIFQPLEEEDIGLAKGKAPEERGKLRSYCESFGSKERAEACWREGWPLYRDEVSTPTGARDYCEQSTSVPARDHCYNMIFWVKAQGLNYDEEGMSGFCDGIDGSVRGMCYGSMANAIIHGGWRNVTAAANFCSLAKDGDSRDECYGLIIKFATYNVAPDSEYFSKLCGNLPDPYKGRCFGMKK